MLLSGEQLQLARKCDWTSLRVDIICFVRQPVFFKFRSRKLNAQTNVRAYNLQARKCDWISLRADIICFVSWTVFLMFCSRKIAYFEEQIIFMDKFSSLIKVIVFIIPQILLRENILLVRIWPSSVTFFDSIAWTKSCSLLPQVILKSNTLYHLRSTTRGISGDNSHLLREYTTSWDVLKAVAREQKIFDGWIGT